MSDPCADATSHVLHAGELRIGITCNTTRLEAEYGPRFDRTAQVTQAVWRGHSFLDERGLPDEFGLHGLGVLGYAEAVPGSGTFLKIGVGALRRVDAGPYRMGGVWPMVKEVRATVIADQTCLVATHEAGNGLWQYRLEKSYQVSEAGALVIHYRLTNGGESTMAVEQYNHNFFRFGADEASECAYAVRPAFAVPTTPPGGMWSRQGNEIVLMAGSANRSGPAWAWEPDAPPDLNQVVLRETGGGMAVKVKGDFRVARMALWTKSSLVCPEIFLRETVPVGTTLAWSRNYLFMADRLGE